jgi:septum formation protein
LEESGYRFDVIPADEAIEQETDMAMLGPIELVAHLARKKGADVHRQAPDRLVLACDTVVSLDREVLGKPSDVADARSMLRKLQGSLHSVHSGLCLWPPAPGEPLVETATTWLRMDRLSDEQIEEYLASGLWQGKAGAFGYQDRQGWLHIVEGSESNVVGLPLELFKDMAARLGQIPYLGSMP